MTEGKPLRQQLRQEFRLKRNSLNVSQQKTAALKITKNICANVDINKFQKVAVYLTNDGEIDLSIFVNHLWQQGKSTYLPVLDHNNSGKLKFVKYTADSSLIPNKYGIEEPNSADVDICPVERLEIIFTPLVAFDAQGNRLGMGGGYYDRTLASLEPMVHTVQLIGLAHSCQQVESLEQQSWDIPMNKIITDRQVIVTPR